MFTDKYKKLSVAFPYDFLNARALIAFYVFCNAARLVKGVVEVPTYVVGEDEESYYLIKFLEGEQLTKRALEMFSTRYRQVSRKVGQIDPTQIVRKDLREFDGTVAQIINTMVKNTPNMKLPKSALAQARV